MRMTNVVIADSETSSTDLLFHILTKELGFNVEIVVETNDAISAIEKINPNVVIVNFSPSSESHGVEFALHVKKKMSPTGVVVISSHVDQHDIDTLASNAAQGWAYMLRESIVDRFAIMRAVYGSGAGLVVLDPSIGANPLFTSGSLIADLPLRHQSVLNLLAQGYSNEGIAQRLGLTEKSIETYLNSTYKTLRIAKTPEINTRTLAGLIFFSEVLSCKHRQR